MFGHIGEVPFSNSRFAMNSETKFNFTWLQQNTLKILLKSKTYLKNMVSKILKLQDSTLKDSTLDLPGVPTGNEQPEVENPIVPRLSAAVTESNT